MSDDPHIAALLYPFDAGILQTSAVRDPVLCIGLAEPLPGGMDLGPVTYVQGFRPDFLKLSRAGCDVLPELGDSGGYGMAFVRLGRNRGQNETWIAAAISRVRDGGFVVVSGGKTDGAASMRKRVAALGVETGHAARKHGIVFWLMADSRVYAVGDQLSPAETPRVDGRFVTAAGMFSHGRVDPGSSLLARFIPERGIGLAADFCAGWGYLSARLLERCPSVRELHLYEADYASLQAAKENLQNSGKTEIAFFWRDLLGEQTGHSYDFIVMNPPFHTGRKAEPDIGRRLVEAASRSLHTRGRLLMVANRQLPYEAMLGACFARVERLCEESGYKVILAQK